MSRKSIVFPHMIVYPAESAKSWPSKKMTQDEMKLRLKLLTPDEVQVLGDGGDLAGHKMFFEHDWKHGSVGTVLDSWTDHKGNLCASAIVDIEKLPNGKIPMGVSLTHTSTLIGLPDEQKNSVRKMVWEISLTDSPAHRGADAGHYLLAENLNNHCITETAIASSTKFFDMTTETTATDAAKPADSATVSLTPKDQETDEYTIQDYKLALKTLREAHDRNNLENGKFIEKLKKEKVELEKSIDEMNSSPDSKFAEMKRRIELLEREKQQTDARYARTAKEALEKLMENMNFKVPEELKSAVANKQPLQTSHQAELLSVMAAASDKLFHESMKSETARHTTRKHPRPSPTSDNGYGHIQKNLRIEDQTTENILRENGINPENFGPHASLFEDET